MRRRVDPILSRSTMTTALAAWTETRTEEMAVAAVDIANILPLRRRPPSRRRSLGRLRWAPGHPCRASHRRRCRLACVRGFLLRPAYLLACARLCRRLACRVVLDCRRLADRLRSTSSLVLACRLRGCPGLHHRPRVRRLTSCVALHRRVFRLSWVSRDRQGCHRDCRDTRKPHRRDFHQPPWLMVLLRRRRLPVCALIFQAHLI